MNIRMIPVALRHCVVAVAMMAVAMTAVVALSAGPATAQTVIRDSEIENTIASYATPLLEAAGLNPGNVRIVLVQDDSLNAFVAGGMNMFLNTGLILRTEHAGQLIGVIAHEAGHISGGHLARLYEELRGRSMEAMLAYILGVAAAVAGGQPELGSAVITGGAHIAQRNLLQFTRTQERSADQAGVGMLDATGQSARGLLEFMRILGDQEALLVDRQDPYVLTHPLTRERVAFLEAHVARSPHSDAPIPDALREQHDRMIAKLQGFLNPQQALRRFTPHDQSVAGRYGRAIALYRRGDTAGAVALIDGLIAESPDDPYFHEIRGQILFESGRAEAALPSQEEAVRLAPREPLIRLSLAQTQIELAERAQNSEDVLRAAIGNLEEVTRRDPDIARAWRLLGIAHGRTGNIGMASLGLAESALRTGELDDALFQSNRAMDQLPTGSAGWLRAQDIHLDAERRRDQQRRRGRS